MEMINTFFNNNYLCYFGLFSISLFLFFNIKNFFNYIKLLNYNATRLYPFVDDSIDYNLINLEENLEENLNDKYDNYKIDIYNMQFKDFEDLEDFNYFYYSYKNKYL